MEKKVTKPSTQQVQKIQQTQQTQKIQQTQPIQSVQQMQPMKQHAHAVQQAAMPMVYPANLPAVTSPSKAMCESYINRYVEVQAVDGFCYDGIVEHVDDEWLCLAVPGAVDAMRGFFPTPFYPPFGPVGPFSPFRPRRFNRLVLPLAALTAISLLPFY